MAVLVFGDSHARYIFARCSEAKTISLGPWTMHRVGRDGASFVPHLTAPTVDDVVLLVFGEIDVRCHLSRVAQLQGRRVEVVIGELVDRYVVSTRAMVEHFGIRSRVFLLGVPPPMDPIAPNDRLPVHGALNERIAIRRMLNTVLEQHVKNFGLGFVPIPACYEKRDGSMRARLSDGHAHIAIDHTGAVCAAVGQAIGRDLGYREPPLVDRWRRAIQRHRALNRKDAASMWLLGEAI